jgi:hypothetical protein
MKAKHAIVIAAVVIISVLIGVGMSLVFNIHDPRYAWLKEVNVRGGFHRNASGLHFGVAPGLAHSSAESTWKKHVAKVCADVILPVPPANGTCFALYAITNTPTNRDEEEWWELDLEFKGNTPGYAWINWFVAGVQDTTVQHLFAYPEGSKNFCMEWSLPELKALWTVDGQVLYRLDLDETWTMPMKFVVSHWSNNMESAVSRPGLDEWMGRFVAEEQIFAAIVNVTVT